MTTAKPLRIEDAIRAVSTSADVMDGAPVFRNTRVLISTVLGSLDEGASLSELKDSYPFLTEELIEAAQIYTQVQPVPWRPKRIFERYPDWEIISIKYIPSTDK